MFIDARSRLPTTVCIIIDNNNIILCILKMYTEKKKNSDPIVRELLYYLGVTGHLL